MQSPQWQGAQQPSYYPVQSSHYPAPGMMVRQPQRNVALIVIGAILLVIALGAGFVFFMNLYQYMTVEDRWANDPMLSRAARGFGVRIIKAAAMRRMEMFGPIMGLFGIGGLVCSFLGIRKK
jgi:hypothetical protein